MTATPAHRCSCRVAARRNRARWMLAAFAFVLLETMLPCHVGPAVSRTSAAVDVRSGAAVDVRSSAVVDVQRLIDAAMCASGQLRLASAPATPGDGTGDSPSALASGCLHCIGLRDDLAASPNASSWLAHVSSLPPALRAGSDQPDGSVAWAVTWPRGPPAGGITSA